MKISHRIGEENCGLMFKAHSWKSWDRIFTCTLVNAQKHFCFWFLTIVALSIIDFKHIDYAAQDKENVFNLIFNGVDGWLL